MAKRAAEEYITKDQGSTRNHHDPHPSDSAEMATPAQLASRKIAAPKSRRGKTAVGAGAGSVSSNSFGQSQQSTFAPPNSSFTFGAGGSQMSFGQDTAQTSTPSVFGQITSQSAPSSFTFDQPSQTNNAPVFSFTNNTQAAQAASSAPSTFAFTQPSLTNGSASPFGFNNTQAIQAASSAPAGFAFTQPSQTNGSASPFGLNNAEAAQPAASAPSGFSFTPATQTNGSGFGFGTKNNAMTTQPASATPKFSFGQPAQTTGSTFSFSSNNNNNEPAQALATAFSLGQPAQANETSSSFGANTKNATTQSAPSTFSFARPAQANGPTFGFGTSNKTDSAQSAPQNFSFGQSAHMEDTTMFSPPRKADMPNFFLSQSTDAASADPAPAPIKSLFPPRNSEEAPSSAPAKSLFPFPDPKPSSSEAPIKSLFQLSDPESVSSPTPVQKPATPAPVRSLFQTLPPLERQEPASSTTPAAGMTPAPSKSLFERTERVPAFSPAPTQASEQAPAPIQFEKVKIRSNGPSELLITDDHTQWMEHDRKYRLRSLNKELVRRLALYDSGSQDFDNVIIFYFRTREKLGLMWPPGARNSNAKRKADDEESPIDRSSPAKKARASEPTPVNTNTKRKADEEELPTTRSSPGKKAKASEPAGDNTNSSRGIFGDPSASASGAFTRASTNIPAPYNGGLSSPAKASVSSTPAPLKSSLSKPYTGPTSNTSKLFQSILSGTSTPNQPSKSKSPFANVPAQPQSAAKALFSFSQPEAPMVTSPTKPVSPPSSNEVDEDEVEQQESDDEESSADEIDDQDPEERSVSGDDDASNDGDDDEQAPPSKPENLGKSLFDRIQPASSAGGEPSLMTPNGLQHKTTLKQAAPNHSFKPYTPFADGFAKSTPQAPTVSPITPFVGSLKSKPLSAFDFTSKVPVTTPTPVLGASIFAGGSLKANGPIPGDGLFGSRPSTPNHDEPASSNIFAGLTKAPQATVDPSKDNTWSKGSPLKFDTPPKLTSGGFTFSGPTNNSTNFMTAFGKNAEQHEKADKAKRKYEDLGSDAEEDEIQEWEAEYEEKQQAKRAKTTSDSGFGQGGFKPASTQVDGQGETATTAAPSFSITAATPPPKGNASSDKFSNLFGQKSETASPAPSATNTVGFSFGTAPTTASALQPAASYLFPSADTSGLSSRATSPGMTDNESVGTDVEADTTNDPQTSLMSDRPGEENEEVLYEARTKALKFMDKAACVKHKGSTPDTYNSVGLGILRVLKNAKTGKSRIVIRAEPGANVLLNTHLAPFISYTNDSRAEGSGVVRFGVAVDNGKIEQWVLKVKNSAKATELARVLTNNKSPTST